MCNCHEPTEVWIHNGRYGGWVNHHKWTQIRQFQRGAYLMFSTHSVSFPFSLSRTKRDDGRPNWLIEGVAFRHPEPGQSPWRVGGFWRRLWLKVKGLK